MTKQDKHNKQTGQTDTNRAEFTETEYTDEQRRTNEVASTAYQGSKKEKVDIQNDRLESGGF
ncbi:MULTISPECIES: hypothetical protein [Sporosarcina]|uniref:Uncharacterized protein n=1 Tax=Sporosarcina saromensis TaxID=359365 RepID=A0ABU4GFC0_9BACL|nr:hypothetical protein [Sporosarcina saromensis]MDW0115013.1 hypothetical protein [Sporosarcina saromensis]